MRLASVTRRVKIAAATDVTALRMTDRSHARSFELHGGIFRRETQGIGRAALYDFESIFEAGVTFVSHRSHRR
jgi:hypothetical protein